MSTGSGLLAKVAVAGAWLALAAGCAGLRVPDPPVDEIAEQRQQRAESAAREFQSKRDFAELQVALAHWNRGELQACEDVLRRLLERNPDNHDAQRMLAELCRADGRPQPDFEQSNQTPLAQPGGAAVQPAAALLPVGRGESDVTWAYYQQPVGPAAGEGVQQVGYETALQAAGQSGTAPGQPTMLVPDPTAEASEPGWAVAVEGANCLRGTARADDSGGLRPRSGAASRPQTPSPAFHAETTSRTDPVGIAEVSETDQVRALFDGGLAALGEGSAQPAVGRFLAAAAIAPDNPQIPITAAMAALRCNRPEVAVDVLRPAQQRFPDSAQLYRILGVSLYRLGDYRSSQVALRQALSLDKSSALTYFLMGCTLSKLGQLESAEAHLRQAQTIDPRYTVWR